MILYRTVWAEHISTDADIINTPLTKYYTGRWNQEDVETIYTGDDPLIAIKEKGHYFVQPAEAITNALKKKARLPAGWETVYNLLYERRVYLAEIEIDDDVKILDLSHDPTASQIFASHGYSLNTTTYRKHAFVSLPTSEFGTKMEAAGYGALKVRSARANEGNCIVVFKRNYSGNIKINGVRELKYTAVTPNGRYHPSHAPCAILHDQFLVQDEDTEVQYSFLKLP